jgi:hypothetical protein
MRIQGPRAAPAKTEALTAENHSHMHESEPRA